MDYVYGFPTIHSHCPESGPLATQQPSVTPAGHEPWAKPVGVTGLEHKEFYQNSIISCAKQKEYGICWILMDLQLHDISCFNHSSTDILAKQKWFPRSSRWPASQSLPTLGSSPQSYRRSVCQMFLGAASSLKSKKPSFINFHTWSRHSTSHPSFWRQLLPKIMITLAANACEASLHGGWQVLKKRIEHRQETGGYQNRTNRSRTICDPCDFVTTGF